MPLIFAGLLRLPFGTVLHHVRDLTRVVDGEPYNVNVVSFNLINLVMLSLGVLLCKYGTDWAGCQAI